MENDNFNFELRNFDSIVDDEAEFIPLLSTEDEEQMNAEKIPDTLPILSLRNTVLFPGVVIPITVGRDIGWRRLSNSFPDNRLTARDSGVGADLHIWRLNEECQFSDQL